MILERFAWWQHAVFYEIYLRSFQDSSGDGVGDLNGVSARLDYLADLGIDAIWITPFYPSPQVDFGYDISNHEDVDPLFGTLADFDRLLSLAHARGIKVVVDIVLNHTSDRHPWFEASRSSGSSPYRDWYVWRDGREHGRPPNNWESVFGGPAWTFDAGTGQWYYHCFYRQQPDLNWRNPAVEARMLDVVRFWIDRGVDGFRLDAVNVLFENPDLTDNPQLPEPRKTLTGIRTQEFLHTRRQREVHDVLKRFRRFVEERAPDAVLISEAYVEKAEELARFYGDDDEMHLPFNFFLAQVPALDAGAFRLAVQHVQQACADRWPSLVLGNHDVDRASDRYGADRPDDRARLLGALLLTLRGTPFLYYGEELGMRTDPPATIEEVRDPVGRYFWPEYKGRDGVRRPMAWDGSPGAGFSRATPWLPLAQDARAHNVATERADPDSVLAFYRALIRLRRDRGALTAGDYSPVASSSDVFAFSRHTASEHLIVALNMSADPREVPASARAGTVLLGTHQRAGAAAGAELTGYEVLIVRSG